MRFRCPPTAVDWELIQDDSRVTRAGVDTIEGRADELASAVTDDDGTDRVDEAADLCVLAGGEARLVDGLLGPGCGDEVRYAVGLPG